MNTPHIQLILDRREVPRPLQAALHRMNARVSVRSVEKALNAGVSPSADVCVILPANHETPDVLDRILEGASQQACGTLVIPPHEQIPGAQSERLSVATVDDLTSADELIGRIRALCEIRRPMQQMREELNRLRQRDAELSSGARERDEQLKLASQIQLDLLPEVPDAAPLSISTLFLPADHVSGDIYDIARLDEEHFSFSIADATGHGLPAALLTVLMKRSFRGKEISGDSYRIIPPDELLQRINEEMVTSSLTHCQFITALHAVFDRPSSRIRWARGGSPYPLLLRPGEYPRQIRSHGGLIGAMPSQRFDVVEQQLEPGDTLLLYTDGLEALLLGRECDPAAILQSPWLDQLATDGPDAALAALNERVETAPRNWPKDDITVIALRMN